MAEEGFQVGIVTFEGSGRARRLGDNLVQSGSLDQLDEVGIIEHHQGVGYKTHVLAVGATKGAHITGGALIGGLVGSFLGPAGFAIGAAVGGATGAATGGRDPRKTSLSDEFIGRIKAALPEDTSAVLVIGPPETVEQTMGKIRSADAVSKGEIREALTDEQVASLRAALEAGTDQA